MKTRFHSLLEAKINELIDSHKADLAAGNVRDIESYRYVVGIIAGLRAAVKLADDTEGDLEG